MVILALLVLFAAAEPLEIPESSDRLAYLSHMILEYPTVSIVLSLLSVIFTILLVREAYKRISSSGEVKFLLKSPHFAAKEHKSLLS